MNREHLVDTVKKIIDQELKLETENIKLNTLLTKLDIDSLDMMKLALALEKSFNITITTSELEQIRTFGDIIDGIETKIPT